MALSVRWYLMLLAAVAVGRLLELVRSRRNQAALASAGSVKSAEPAYKWMVALHTGVLAGSALEVLLADRPFQPMLAGVSAALFVASNAVRWWVIRTLGTRWNVEVMSASPKLGVITANGPYRWVRHPNYTAVFVEMLALPLIHSAFVVALIGTALHVLVLRHRVRLEESVLMKSAEWRAAFAGRPRFFPGIV